MWTFKNFPDKHIGPHFKEGEDRKEEGRIGERGTEAGDRPPTSLGLKVALYMSTKCVNLLEQSKHRQQTSGRLKRTPQRYKILREHIRTLTLRLPALSAYSTLLPRSR